MRLAVHTFIIIEVSVNDTLFLYILAIQMTWDLTLNAEYEPIDKYQIYAYQETAGIPASVSLWKLVGDVESLDLPMACTLTQVNLLMPFNLFSERNF